MEEINDKPFLYKATGEIKSEFRNQYGTYTITMHGEPKVITCKKFIFYSQDPNNAFNQVKLDELEKFYVEKVILSSYPIIKIIMENTQNKEWVPTLKGINHQFEDGEYGILEIVDWTGGEGEKPAVNVYLGDFEYTEDINKAAKYDCFPEDFNDALDSTIKTLETTSQTPEKTEYEVNYISVPTVEVEINGKKYWAYKLEWDNYFKNSEKNDV